MLYKTINDKLTDFLEQIKYYRAKNDTLIELYLVLLHINNNKLSTEKRTEIKQNINRLKNISSILCKIEKELLAA